MGLGRVIWNIFGRWAFFCRAIDMFPDVLSIIFHFFLKGNDLVPAEKGSSVNRCSCCGEPLKMSNSKKHGRNPLLKATLLSNASTSSPRALIGAFKNEETRHLELPHIQYTELKLMSDADSELQEDEIGVNADCFH